MTLENRLSLSYYQEIDAINKEHEVFLVKHLETGKFFVKKTLRIYNLSVFTSLMKDPVAGTPHIFELFEDEDTLIVIEEYLTGDTLEEMLQNGHRFTEEEVLSIAISLCKILHVLHHRNPPVIHRDLKPSNILISPDQRVHLLDLNAAKYVTEGGSKDTVLLGTQGYAAPEQYGFGSSTVQTDIYSFGVLINMLLTGRFPQERRYEGRLSHIITKCTRLEPENRYKSIAKLSEELVSLSDTELAFDDATSAKTNRRPKATKSLPDWMQFLPPGFRTLRIHHMLLAAVGYYLTLFCGSTLEITNTFGARLIWERFCFIMFVLSVVFFSSNYLHIQEKLPLTNSGSSWIRLCGILLYDALIVIVLFFLMLVMELLFFR